MSTKIPEAIAPLLAAYVAALDAELPGYRVGCYLYGSIALDDYCPPFSDIDFITVTPRRSTWDDLARLAAIHAALQRAYPAAHLSGSYLLVRDLGQPAAAIAPAPYYHEDRLHLAGQHDLNAVTWWGLQQHGITLAGPPDPLASYVMDWDRFVADTRANLNSYWVRYTREPARLASLLTDEGIQWAVLGVLRQYYTFCERGITTKTGAGQYGLAHLPARWHRIIQAALDVRGQHPSTAYRLRVARAVDAVRFLRYLIPLCNAICAARG